MNVDDILEIFPDLDIPTARRVARLGAAPLSTEEARDVLRLFSKGKNIHDICLKMGIDQKRIEVHKLIYPDFTKRMATIKKARKHRVKQTLEEYCAGCWVKKRTTRIAVLDEDTDEPVIENGKQVMRIHKIETETVPPNAAPVMFFLKAMFPEQYGNFNADDTLLTPAELEEKLAKYLPKLRIDDTP